MAPRALQQLFRSVSVRGNIIRKMKLRAVEPQTFRTQLGDLLRLKDESSMLTLAKEILDNYRAYGTPERIEFFSYLHSQFCVDSEQLVLAAEAYQANPSAANVQRLNAMSTPARRQLFEIFNMTPGGTQQLVQMRADLLQLLREYPELKAVDTDLKVLFSAWFNRGFLSLERISWDTKASVLERLMKYEAVHEISGWDDLRKRVSPGRRCFAFFHPALPDEPIIFVQVALVAGLSGSVDDIIRSDEEHLAEDDADTAIFYSISNCQSGLRGIAFGDLLIKQVVEQLSAELPHIKTYATLSPIPGFGKWLAKSADGDDLLPVTAEERVELKALVEDCEADWAGCEARSAALKPLLERLCAYYMVAAKSGEQPLDPVSRFHLRNGAGLERINWLGDRSAKGLKQSHGLLVNYLYDPSAVTRNHERYVYENSVICSSSITDLAQN